jgi:hypothetical protein
MLYHMSKQNNTKVNKMTQANTLELRAAIRAARNVTGLITYTDRRVDNRSRVSFVVGRGVPTQQVYDDCDRANQLLVRNGFDPVVCVTHVPTWKGSTVELAATGPRAKSKT